MGVCQEGLLIPNKKTKPGLSTVSLPGMQTRVLEGWQPRWNYEGKNHKLGVGGWRKPDLGQGC